MNNTTQPKKGGIKQPSEKIVTPTPKETKPESITSSPSSSLLDLNTIIPIITFILFVLLLCHTLMKYGLHRYFSDISDINASLNTDELKYTILHIIGVLLCIFIVIFLLYYISSSPVINYSFRFSDIMTMYSLQDYIYSFFFIIALLIIVTLPLIIKLYTPESPEYNVYSGSTSSFILGIMIVYWIVTTLQSSDMKVVSNLASFIENFKIYIMSFLFILFNRVSSFFFCFHFKKKKLHNQTKKPKQESLSFFLFVKIWKFGVWIVV